MKNGIRKRWIGLMLGCLAWSIGTEVVAQTPEGVSDSISIISLIEQVEKATPYKIYTNISKPFMVKKQEGEVSLELLKNALAGTFWRMNVYGKKVFVIQDHFSFDALFIKAEEYEEGGNSNFYFGFMSDYEL